ncbi:MAG: exosortase U [Planctomycetota bacterium]
MSTASAAPSTSAALAKLSRPADTRWNWFWLGVGLMSLPMLIPYLLEMWGQEHYQYFPFVFLFIGYQVWTRSDRQLRAPRGTLGWSLVVIGGVAMAVSVLAPSAWLAGLAFVLFAFAMLQAMEGPDDPNLAVLGVPLLMLVKLPFGLDQLLINRLQRVTTDLSSVVLDLLVVPHSITGNTVTLPTRELFVAEACSGIQSVFTLAFLACVIVAWQRRRIWLTPIYLLISCLLAVSANTLRVTAVALAESWYQTDLASGWQHDMLGYVALIVAALFLLSFDQLVVMLLHPASAGGNDRENVFIRLWNFLVADWKYQTDDEVAYGYREKKKKAITANPMTELVGRLLGRKPGWIACLALAGTLAVGSAIRATQVEVNQVPRELVRSFLLFDPSAEFLQGKYDYITVGGHQQTRNGSEPRLGQHADRWDFETPEKRPGQIVVSQTYSGWHELCVCYENMDWKLLAREVTDVDPNSVKFDTTKVDDHGAFVTARFRNGDAYGYLMFTAVQEDGTVLDAPSQLEALGARFFSRLERYDVITQQNLVMLQLWMVTPEKMDKDAIGKIQQDFLAVRDKVAAEVVQKPTPASNEEA